MLLIFAGALIGQQFAGSNVINATFYALQIGTVLILVAYVLATVGAIRFLFFQVARPRRQCRSSSRRSEGPSS